MEPWGTEYTMKTTAAVPAPYTTRNDLSLRYDLIHRRVAKTELTLEPEQQQLMIDSVEGCCQVEETQS